MSTHSFITATLLLLLLATLIFEQVDSRPYDELYALKYIENKLGLPNCDSGKYLDDDACRNTTQLITSKGYPCEEHTVTTDDGFILNIQRIPAGHRQTADAQSQARPVVFVQHGLLDSSATWVMNMANQSLGFILADAGFDVWLGNLRGNTYSRSHVKYVPSDKEFWEFSWDQMADYDLPAMLKYVLLKTGQKELFYVGHSQGTLIAFSRLSRDQTLAKKVKAFIALGPVATVGNIKGLMRLLVGAMTEEKFLFDLFGVHEFLPNNRLLRLIASQVCGREIFEFACENFVFLISGFDYRQFNATRMPVYFSHTPAGTSVQNMVHFAQMVKSGQCQAYDFGNKELNVKHYNQSDPPVYDISLLNVPTYIFSGDKDYLADRKDVSQLLSKLKCVVSHEEIRGWQHLDFLWSLDATSRVYNKIVDILRQNELKTLK